MRLSSCLAEIYRYFGLYETCDISRRVGILCFLQKLRFRVVSANDGYYLGLTRKVAMRSFIIRLFILLGLVFPALASAATPLNLITGWNLLGNSSAAPIDVTTTFNDATKITTVWKWNETSSKWAFYAPSMTPSALTTYATNKGYDVLVSIHPKEGFWVNASTDVALIGPEASWVMLAERDLQSGWNLVSSADNQTPSQLNQVLGSSLNAVGKTIITAWAWDAPNKSWKFFAPSLEANGGLAAYIASKGYLPFSAALTASDGFWLNVGTAITGTAPYIISGTVAVGEPWDGARVCAKTDTLESATDCAIADARGGFMLPLFIQPPWHFKAEKIIGNTKINLFSLSYETGGKVNVNITPITDMITRVEAYDDTGDASDNSVWNNPISGKSAKVEQIKASAKTMFGGMADNTDPIRDPFVPDPAVSQYDRLIEDTRLALNGGNVTVSDVNGRIMATAPVANIVNNSVSGDAQTVTQAEGDAARVAGDYKRAAAASSCTSPQVLQSDGSCAAPPPTRCISPEVLSSNGVCYAPSSSTSCSSSQILLADGTWAKTSNGNCWIPSPTNACSAPQVLQNLECVMPPTCTSPQVLQNGTCINPAPAPTCVSPQVLQGNQCITPTSTTKVISAVSPATATLNQLTTFTVSGTNLTNGMLFNLEGCSVISELPGGTDTSRQFSCTPIASGPMAGVIKDQPGGTSLYIFHVAVGGLAALLPNTLTFSVPFDDGLSVLAYTSNTDSLGSMDKYSIKFTTTSMPDNQYPRHGVAMWYVKDLLTNSEYLEDISFGGLHLRNNNATDEIVAGAQSMPMILDRKYVQRCGISGPPSHSWEYWRFGAATDYLNGIRPTSGSFIYTPPTCASLGVLFDAAAGTVSFSATISNAPQTSNVSLASLVASNAAPTIIASVTGSLSFTPLNAAAQAAAMAAQQAAYALADQQAADALAAKQAADALAAQQAAAALAVQQAAAALAAQQAAQQAANAALAAQQASAATGTTGSGTAAQYFTKNAVGNHWTFLSACTGPHCPAPTSVTSTITAFAGGVATIQATTSGISSTSTNQIDATGALISTSSPFTYTVASMTFTIPGTTAMVLPATFSVGTSWEIAPAISSVSATTSTIAAFNVARTVPGGTFTDCLQINTTSTTTTTIMKTTYTTTSYYSPTAGTTVETINMTLSEYTGTDAAMAAITNSTMIIASRLQAGYVANP